MKGGTKWDESRGCGRHVDVQGEDNERIVESVFVDSVADFLTVSCGELFAIRMGIFHWMDRIGDIDDN